MEDNYQGGTSRLSCEQEAALDKHLQEHTYTSSKEVKSYIEQAFGVKYTVEGVRKLLYRLGFSYKKPKHTPGKADIEEQRRFVEEYERLKATKQEEDRIYFMDGCHPHHNSIPA